MQAHGRICLDCEPAAEWSVTCPLCLDVVTARGRSVLPHDISGKGRRMEGFPCPGSGAAVDMPVPAEPVRAVWPAPKTGRRLRTVALAPEVAS